MALNRQTRLPLKVLFGALMIIPPAAVLVSIPWLKQQPDGLVFLLTGAAAALTIAASFALAVLHDRHIDEWERSNARFASQWGWAAGGGVLGVALALPVVRGAIVTLAASMTGVSNPDQQLVVLVFTAGFIATILTQLACIVLLSFAWVYWKSRAAPNQS